MAAFPHVIDILSYSMYHTKRLSIVQRVINAGADVGSKCCG
jgi:hypothetical protein